MRGVRHVSAQGPLGPQAPSTGASPIWDDPRRVSPTLRSFPSNSDVASFFMSAPSRSQNRGPVGVRRGRRLHTPGPSPNRGPPGQVSPCLRTFPSSSVAAFLLFAASSLSQNRRPVVVRGGRCVRIQRPLGPQALNTGPHRPGVSPGGFTRPSEVSPPTQWSPSFFRPLRLVSRTRDRGGSGGAVRTRLRTQAWGPRRLGSPNGRFRRHSELFSLASWPPSFIFAVTSRHQNRGPGVVRGVRRVRAPEALGPRAQG